MTAEEWTPRDLHMDRPDVPGHAFTLTAQGLLFVVHCTCGWATEKPLHLSNLCAVRNRHRIEATARPQPAHDHGREENANGSKVRVACSCGYRGQWRWTAHPLLDRQLHSDDGEHIYSVKRNQP